MAPDDTPMIWESRYQSSSRCMLNTMLDRVRLIYAAHVFTAYGAVVGDDRPVEEVAQ